MAVTQPKKRAVLDIKTKKLIIEMSSQGLSHQKIAERFQIGRSTVTKILLNKHRILNTNVNEDRKRIRNSPLLTLENVLLEWCLKHCNWDIDTLYYKATEFINEHKLSCQIPNLSWFETFLNKYNLTSRIHEDTIVKSNVPTNIYDNNVDDYNRIKLPPICSSHFVHLSSPTIIKNEFNGQLHNRY